MRKKIKIEKKKVVTKRNSEFESIRKKRQISNYSKIFSSLNFKPIYLVRASLIIIPFLIIILGVSFLFNNQYYLINKVDVYGYQRIGIQGINTHLNKYLDRNIISLSKNEILSDLKADYLELKDINIIKVYPNVLKVEIIENQPAIIFFDLDSIELISLEGYSVGKIEGVEIALNENEKDIVMGGGNPDSNYIRDRMQSEAQGSFQWEKVPAEERLKVLEVFKSEVDFKLQEYLNKVIGNIGNTSFKDLLIVYRKDFTKESLDGEFISFLLTMSENIKQKGLDILKINILNRYDLEYELKDNKKIIFTARRLEESQINDLNAVVLNNEFSNGSVFDFRSNSYSIR